MNCILSFLKKYWYQLFKYVVYLSVLTNVFLFLSKDLVSVTHRFGANFTIFQLFEAFTNTLDTAAWVVLLLLFELETFVLPKAKMSNLVKWMIRGISAVCFLLISSSFYGYLQSYFWLQGFTMSGIDNICGVIGQSWMTELDEFKTIQKETCTTLAKGTTFFQHSTKNIYTDNYFLRETNWLAGIDVLNSFTWILVVILLEIEVVFRQKKRVVELGNYVKHGLYGLLLFCAIYWGIYGDFLEFWDAFLWIIAFVFIELNLLGWGVE